jgi:hypothetical protein
MVDALDSEHQRSPDGGSEIDELLEVFFQGIVCGGNGFGIKSGASEKE